MRVNTEAIGFKADQKLLNFIEKKTSKLDRFYEQIIDAEVILKLENSGQIRGKIAEIKINVPGETLFAKNVHRKFESAVDESVEALRRQLIKYKETTRHAKGMA